MSDPASDDALEDSQDVVDPTSEYATSSSQDTQSTQLASSQSSQESEDLAHLWGCLYPYNGSKRIEFRRENISYTLGRSRSNDVVLSKDNPLVGKCHCSIDWNGKDGQDSIVTIHNFSPFNGTFAKDGEVPSEGVVLDDGDDIVLGTKNGKKPRMNESRYVYHHLADWKPSIRNFYRLGKRLGWGAFSTVVYAVHKTDGIYAVKILKAGKVDRESYEREISILSQLEHENICQIREVFESGEGKTWQPYIVMELVEGGDLAAHLDGGALFEGEAQHLTCQICDGVAHFHELGITHRDLKPANILLTNDEPPKVKIADFGLAKAVNSKELLKSMCGTPAYYAPELFADNKKGYDNRVDSFCIGVIVFQMLTGSLPFKRPEDPDMETKEHVTTREVEWHSWNNQEPKLSNQAGDFVECMVQKDYNERYTVAEARHHPWLTEFVEEDDSDEITEEIGGQAISPGGSQSTLRDEANLQATSTVHDYRVKLEQVCDILQSQRHPESYGDVYADDIDNTSIPDSATPSAPGTRNSTPATIWGAYESMLQPHEDYKDLGEASAAGAGNDSNRNLVTSNAYGTRTSTPETVRCDDDGIPEISSSSSARQAANLILLGKRKSSSPSPEPEQPSQGGNGDESPTKRLRTSVGGSSIIAARGGSPVPSLD
ncbi:kinase-like domain-containing protein [Sparassis latifolia]